MTVWPTRKKGRVDNCGVDNGGVNVLLVRLVVDGELLMENYLKL